MDRDSFSFIFVGKWNKTDISPSLSVRCENVSLIPVSKYLVISVRCSNTIALRLIVEPSHFWEAPSPESSIPVVDQVKNYQSVFSCRVSLFLTTSKKVYHQLFFIPQPTEIGCLQFQNNDDRLALFLINTVDKLYFAVAAASPGRASLTWRPRWWRWTRRLRAAHSRTSSYTSPRWEL